MDKRALSLSIGVLIMAAASAFATDAANTQDPFSSNAVTSDSTSVDDDDGSVPLDVDSIDPAPLSASGRFGWLRPQRQPRSRDQASISRSSIPLDSITLEGDDRGFQPRDVVASQDRGFSLVDWQDSSTWRPLDTLMLFGGLEGSKQPQDFGVNANFGSRWAANWGFPLLADYGIGAQIGTSINQTDNAVQVFDRVGETAHRTQNFSTVGIFQRYDRWRWGVGYDFLYESYYDHFFLGQWRGRGGYAVSDKDEFGVWFTVSQHHDSGLFLNIPVTLTPLSQGNVYWQHQFETGPRTMAWCGVSEGHGQVNLALGDLPKTHPQFVFGAEVDVPLNRYFAIYGQANFISPADSGTVDSYLGIAYYPSGHAFPAMRNPFTPFLALANSTMFATNLTR